MYFFLIQCQLRLYFLGSKYLILNDLVPNGILLCISPIPKPTNPLTRQFVDEEGKRVNYFITLGEDLFLGGNNLYSLNKIPS